MCYLKKKKNGVCIKSPLQFLPSVLAWGVNFLQISHPAEELRSAWVVQRVVKLDLKWGSPPDQATSFLSLQIRKRCSTLRTWGVLFILEWTTTTKYLLVRLSDLVKQNIGRPVRYNFQIKKYPFSPQYCMGYTYMNKVFFIENSSLTDHPVFNLVTLFVGRWIISRHITALSNTFPTLKKYMCFVCKVY